MFCFLGFNWTFLNNLFVVDSVPKADLRYIWTCSTLRCLHQNSCNTVRLVFGEQRFHSHVQLLLIALCCHDNLVALIFLTDFWGLRSDRMHSRLHLNHARRRYVRYVAYVFTADWELITFLPKYNTWLQNWKTLVLTFSATFLNSSCNIPWFQLLRHDQ